MRISKNSRRNMLAPRLTIGAVALAQVDSSRCLCNLGQHVELEIRAADRVTGLVDGEYLGDTGFGMQPVAHCALQVRQSGCGSIERRLA